MGWGDSQCFNARSKIATPHIDRLAAEGMKFTIAHAGASIRVPSRHRLLTGWMPYRNWSTTGVKGVKKQTKNGRDMMHFPHPQLQAEPGRLNLATLMKRLGYATACVCKWHQGMSSKTEAVVTLKMSPVDFGFDYYFGLCPVLKKAPGSNHGDHGGRRARSFRTSCPSGSPWFIQDTTARFDAWLPPI